MAKGCSSGWRSVWFGYGGTVGTLTGANAVGAVGIGERGSDGNEENVGRWRWRRRSRKRMAMEMEIPGGGWMKIELGQAGSWCGEGGGQRLWGLTQQILPSQIGQSLS